MRIDGDGDDDAGVDFHSIELVKSPSAAAADPQPHHHRLLHAFQSGTARILFTDNVSTTNTTGYKYQLNKHEVLFD